MLEADLDLDEDALEQLPNLLRFGVLKRRTHVSEDPRGFLDLFVVLGGSPSPAFLLCLAGPASDPAPPGVGRACGRGWRRDSRSGENPLGSLVDLPVEGLDLLSEPTVVRRDSLSPCRQPLAVCDEELLDRLVGQKLHSELADDTIEKVPLMDCVAEAGHRAPRLCNGGNGRSRDDLLDGAACRSWRAHNRRT